MMPGGGYDNDDDDLWRTLRFWRVVKVIFEEASDEHAAGGGPRH